MFGVYKYLLVFSLLFTDATVTVNASKILVLFPHASDSHVAVMRAIVMELCNKHKHNVTLYSSHRLAAQVDNLTEIVVEPEYPFWTNWLKKVGQKGGLLEDLSQLHSDEIRKSLAKIGAEATDYFLSSDSLQKLLNLLEEEFDYDLIIVDLFYSEALLAIGERFARPTIGIVNTDFENYMEIVQESIVPTACSPINFDTYTTDIGYWERLFNIRQCISRRKAFAKHNYGLQEELIRKHFEVKSASITELLSKLAIVLLNNHVPLQTPRPLLHNIIPAGGLHIRPARELPWNIKRFLDDSRAGIIYINLGNELRCAELPKDKLQMFFNIFGKRKERILWTCHDADKLKTLPKNIMLQHMTPQSDILAHPHIRLFIMNGDLLSLQEGIVRHVPMLGLPIFRNEIHNMNLAVRLGVGVKLHYSNLTETSLAWALETLVNDANYPLTIRKVSTEFRDRPLGALETCIYWVHYVLRHNSGSQIKTRGIGIPSCQLHLFDLFVFYFGIVFVIISLLIVAYALVRFIRSRKHAGILHTKSK